MLPPVLTILLLAAATAPQPLPEIDPDAFRLTCGICGDSDALPEPDDAVVPAEDDRARQARIRHLEGRLAHLNAELARRPPTNPTWALIGCGLALPAALLMASWALQPGVDTEISYAGAAIYVGVALMSAVVLAALAIQRESHHREMARRGNRESERRRVRTELEALRHDEGL